MSEFEPNHEDEGALPPPIDAKSDAPRPPKADSIKRQRRLRPHFKPVHAKLAAGAVVLGGLTFGPVILSANSQESGRENALKSARARLNILISNYQSAPTPAATCLNKLVLLRSGVIERSSDETINAAPNTQRILGLLPINMSSLPVGNFNLNSNVSSTIAPGKELPVYRPLLSPDKQWLLFTPRDESTKRTKPLENPQQVTQDMVAVNYGALQGEVAPDNHPYAISFDLGPSKYVRCGVSTAGQVLTASGVTAAYGVLENAGTLKYERRINGESTADLP